MGLVAPTFTCMVFEAHLSFPLFSAEPDAFNPGEYHWTEVPTVCSGLHEDHVWQHQQLPTVGHRCPGLCWNYPGVRGIQLCCQHHRTSKIQLGAQHLWTSMCPLDPGLSMIGCLTCIAVPVFFPEQCSRCLQHWIPLSIQWVLGKNRRSWRFLLQWSFFNAESSWLNWSYLESSLFLYF